MTAVVHRNTSALGGRASALGGRASALGVTALLAMGLGGCGSSSMDLVKIDGSSTVYPITEAVAEEFQRAGGARVTTGISGTGGGFKRFCRGTTDISDASRPILTEEMAACAKAGVTYIELPVAMDAIAVVVGTGNTWVDHLTVAELKTMWAPAAQGRVKSWRQIRAGFPDVPLSLAGPGADSGTFDYFTEAIVGRAKASRGDYQASEDDNVTVQFVSRNAGALGYVGLAYYEENRDKLKVVPIQASARAHPVVPSVTTARDGTYQPLARPLFIYVSAASAQRDAVRKFVDFYLTDGGALAKEVGYVDLPAREYAQARRNFAAGKLGTGFGGVPEVGVRIADLLQREGKL